MGVAGSKLVGFDFFEGFLDFAAGRYSSARSWAGARMVSVMVAGRAVGPGFGGGFGCIGGTDRKDAGTDELRVWCGLLSATAVRNRTRRLLPPRARCPELDLDVVTSDIST